MSKVIMIGDDSNWDEVGNCWSLDVPDGLSSEATEAYVKEHSGEAVPLSLSLS